MSTKRSKPGSVCVARGQDVSRLVLVVAVDAELANVCLLTNDVEGAGSNDVLLSPAETGLPYALLAEHDLVGGVFYSQLDPPLAQVDLDLLDRPGAGLPILWRHDSRWDWKLAELAELHRLGAACFRALVDD